MSRPPAEAVALARALAASVALMHGRIDGLELTFADGWIVCVCPPIPHPPFTAIHAYDAGADHRLAAALADAVGVVERRRLPARLLLAGGGFPQTQAAARALGLTETESIPGMVATSSELVAPPPVAATIRRAASVADLEAIAHVAGACLGPTAALTCTETVRDTPGITLYLAETRDGPACCALTARTDDDLGIFLVGTLPDQRRRGLAGAVVAQAVADGFADGAKLAYLQSSASGYGVYRALGFRKVTRELRMARPAALGG